jgi:hypothetical protein
LTAYFCVVIYRCSICARNLGRAAEKLGCRWRETIGIKALSSPKYSLWQGQGQAKVPPLVKRPCCYPWCGEIKLMSIMSQGVSMKRRKVDLETKMVTVLLGLRGESSVSAICFYVGSSCQPCLPSGFLKTPINEPEVKRPSLRLRLDYPWSDYGKDSGCLTCLLLPYLRS